MTRRDYSDDEDYYTQEFEQQDIVSVWLGMLGGEHDTEADVLQDLCGVGYYRLDDQEIHHVDFKQLPVEQLISALSYSDSFLVQTVEAATKRSIHAAKWVLVQYDFNYNPIKVQRPVAADPIFIGSFPYIAT